MTISTATIRLGLLILCLVTLVATTDTEAQDLQVKCVPTIDPSYMGSTMDGWYRILPSAASRIRQVTQVVHNQRFRVLLVFFGYAPDNQVMARVTMTLRRSTPTVLSLVTRPMGLWGLEDTPAIR